MPNITVTAQNPIMQDLTVTEANSFYSVYERAPNPEDNSDFQYQKVQYSNGYQEYITLGWGSDAIQSQINQTIANFASSNPPMNWQPYPGYSPPSS